ncbi:MAG: hypothetical protein IJF52_05815 [Clostridia bacterium]|nr:hypothetical protein [Clostridia bacterium]
MNIGFNGFCENTVTFEADSTVEKGTLVKLIDDNTVGACTEGDKVVGVCVNVREGYAAVQIKGYAEIPVEGAVNVGYQTFSAASDKSVQFDAQGRECLVVSTDTDSIGVIL